MAGRKRLRGEIVLKEPTRKAIISAIEEAESSPSITDLEKTLQINRGTLKHHLKILVEAGIVKQKKFETEPGKPVRFNSKRKDFEEKASKLSDEERKKAFEKDKPKIIRLLKYLEENRHFTKKELRSINFNASKLAEALERDGYLDSIYILTGKSKKLIS